MLLRLSVTALAAWEKPVLSPASSEGLILEQAVQPFTKAHPGSVSGFILSHGPFPEEVMVMVSTESCSATM